MKLPEALSRLLDPLADRPPAPPPAAPRRSGIYLGQGMNGPVLAGPEEHVLVLGPPRSGKTTRLVVPALHRHTGPAVVTSTKPDILHATTAQRATLGRCWHWDPSGTTPAPGTAEPLRWSPIPGCDNWDTAVARAHALAGAARPNQTAHDTHWIERAEALLAPLLHTCAAHRGDMAVLLSWLHRRELLQPLSLLEEEGSRRAADLLKGLAHTDTRELSGIFSTADSILAAYRSDAALNAARRPNFDPDDFAASTDTVYLVSPGASQGVHAALVVALLEQIRSATYERHPRPPVLYALDEVAQIAPWANLPAVLAEGGSQGLTVMACLQDLSQARARWGHAADGFLTLFTHKVILSGVADMITLKAVSDLAGEVDVPVRSTNRTDTLLPKSSTAWTTHRRPRLPIAAVAGCQPGTAFLMSGTNLSRVRI